MRLLVLLAVACTAMSAFAGTPPESASVDGRPRVFITTDLNIGKGDPDDGQSLAHLLWYLDCVDVRGIGIDRPDAGGVEAAHSIIDAYEKDFSTPGTRFKALGFAEPAAVRSWLCNDETTAVARLVSEAMKDGVGPLWLLGWGNLHTIGRALREHPEIATRVRLISIGTHTRDVTSGGDGRLPNWNAPGREEIFTAFPKLWWIEIDRAYNGMFEGAESTAMKNRMAVAGGALGAKIRDLIATVDWATNFRAGDTPSLLYLLDPLHDPDRPENPSWAGRFIRPFPEERPYFWTEPDGGLGWNYLTPPATWANAVKFGENATIPFLLERPGMYQAILERLELLYPDHPRVARPRVIVMTDGEVDDQSSFVRFLAFSSDYDIEGIIATHSVWQKDGHGLGWLNTAIDHYAEILPNLRRYRADFPEPAHLRSVLVEGDQNRLTLEKEPPFIDTPGSELITRSLLSDDPRPLQISIWGGSSTLAHALHKLRANLPPLEFARVAAKVRAYCVSFQDASGKWLAKNVPEARILEAGSWYQTWSYHPQAMQPFPEYLSRAWVEQHLRASPAALLANYPQAEISEGDTPAFLGLIENGLNLPDGWALGGWGGRFEQKPGAHWTDAPDAGSTHAALTRWTPATQNAFQTRAAWMSPARIAANQPPRVVVNGVPGYAPLVLFRKSGSRVTLSANGSLDPEGGTLSFRWSVYPQVHGSLAATLLPAEGSEWELTLPETDHAVLLPVLLEVADSGHPVLTSYRRVLIRVSP
ncbi:nucleoside hydrolase-like domain-containing protein [Nibricoccus sp. IMCC34717]|uniref:nucleoside hydrolase-like domain-containing protein n=1 Tax=Nibricoccus sp. IMCC34717 TaxID=3034021 RepID=UPI00384FFE3F